MADDKQKGNATGFSGLSTLVSDVEDNRPAAEQPTSSRTSAHTCRGSPGCTHCTSIAQRKE